ncbi:MAG: histidinol-phosphatase [Candidatus Nanopelagicales bacterium]
MTAIPNPAIPFPAMPLPDIPAAAKSSAEGTASALALELALSWELADIADAISMDRFGAADLKVESKPDLTPVTEADKAVEQAIRAAIAMRFPDDVVAGEEFGGFEEGRVPGGRVWIIDPIDGTKNYVRGVPIWATLIALVIDGTPTLGLVSAPALGRRWWAGAGVGAWTQTRIIGADLTPRRLDVSAVSSLEDASFSYSDREGWADRTSTGFDALVAAVWRTRAYGDFYSHLLVAEGAVDIAAEPELSAWDIAALIPIITEAGGSVTGYDGSDALSSKGAFTTNGLLHQRVMDCLR